MGSGIRKYIQISHHFQCQYQLQKKTNSSCLIGIHFQKPTLFTTDLRGLHHVLTHNNIYQKPDLLRQSLSKITGQGEYTPFKARMWPSLYPDQASCGWKVINIRIRGELWYAQLIIGLSLPQSLTGLIRTQLLVPFKYVNSLISSLKRQTRCAMIIHYISSSDFVVASWIVIRGGRSKRL